MSIFLRALALTIVVAAGHVANLLLHHDAPATSSVSNAEQLVAQHRILRTEHQIELAFRVRRAAPRLLRATLPRTGAAFAMPHYSGSIAKIIQQAFAPLGANAVSWAERVAMCESGDNPAAHSWSGAMGLFQIMPGTWAGTPYAGSSPYDAVANSRAAAWIYAHRGPSAWSCG